MISADQIIQNSDVGAVACQKSAGIFEFLCSWQSLAGMALVTSAVLLAFLYLFSVMFRNENLKNFVKLEIFEIFITAVIIILLIGGVGALNTVKFSTLVEFKSFPEGVTADATIYNVTESYFHQIGKDMGAWLEMNYILGVYIDQMASVTPYARPMGIGLVASPLAGLASPFKQLIYNMSIALAIAYIMNYAQLYVYLFALAGSLHFYLPLGIILRSFTPTRRIGGALIGLAISFLFFFPMLYSLNYMMFYSKEGASPMVTFNSFVTQSMSYKAGDDSIAGKAEENYKNKFSAGLIDMATSTIAGIGQIFASFIGKFFTLLMVLPIATVGRAFAIGFIMPAFNILLMIQATKTISKAIGEEVDITTLTRMI
jgi:hypothetical protein